MSGQGGVSALPRQSHCTIFSQQSRRALAWAGPADAGKVLRQIVKKVPEAAIHALRQHASVFPLWLQDALKQAGQARVASNS